jgi:proteasome lid subunit RPN8/RPN11
MRKDKKNKHQYATIGAQTPATAPVHTATAATIPTTIKTVVVPKRTEIKKDFTPTLILATSFIDKVKFLHKTVKLNTEWSAILLYSTKEGSIDDAVNWVISVDDLILMDIGTSAYTEYDMEAGDDYATEKWMDHLEKEGGKIGHLHTHHNMNCYFSGTDMKELHDNAPQHNYYLSLIVNYKDIDSWCAKVAVCGTEVTKGSIVTTKTWKGAKGVMSKEESDSIDVSKDVLYLMDCKLITEAETTIPDDLVARVKSIEADKAASYISHTNYHNRGAVGYTPKTIYTSPSTKKEDDLDEWDDVYPKKYPSFTPLVTQKNDHTLSTYKFSPSKVAPLLVKILRLAPASIMSLDNALMGFETMVTHEQYEHIVKCEAIFEEYCKNFFKEVDLTPIHFHAIANSMYNLLNNYIVFGVHDLLDSMLVSYLLEEGEYIPAVVTSLTGLKVEEQWDLETEKK